MLIFVILTITILTGSNFIKISNYRENIYFYLVLLAMIIIVGLRDISVGKYDTQYIYTPRISMYFSFSYNDILDYQKKDKLFYLIAKFISNIYQDINFVLFFLSIPFLVSVVYLVKKYSSNPCLSFILFLGLQYFTMSFFLLRQVIAISFCIYAFDALINKKIYLFLLMVIVASFFHQTALIFLLAYPLSFFKIGYKQFTLVLLSFILSLVITQSSISNFFVILNSLLSDSGRYSFYETVNSSLGYTGFFIQLVFFLCVTYAYRTSISKRMKFFRKQIENRNINIDNSVIRRAKYCDINSITIMYNFATVSLILMAFSAIIGEFWRVASYFGIFNILLLPNIIFFTNKLIKITLTLSLGGVLLVYFFVFHLDNAQVLPYIFCWQ